ncbi:MAG: nitroreductase family protein [Negativicutes bacterium]|nr:nitroreductase family protein [Negativicutes bacterium]
MTEVKKMIDGKQIVTERRAVNFFDPKRELPQATLEAIINLAVLAPSAFNLQPWRIVAVKSPEAKQRLFRQANNQDKILEAPVTLIIIGDRSAFAAENPAWEELAAMLQDDARLKGLQSFAKSLYGTSDERRVKFAESNAGLLAMSIMYAAKYYDVDSHPMSGIDFAGIKAEFSLKADEEAVMLIGLGYLDPAKKLFPRRKRLGYGEIVQEV